MKHLHTIQTETMVIKSFRCSRGVCSVANKGTLVMFNSIVDGFVRETETHTELLKTEKNRNAVVENVANELQITEEHVRELLKEISL